MASCPEEIFYIINGTGKIKIGNEEARLRDGDIIYIPENTQLILL